MPSESARRDASGFVIIDKPAGCTSHDVVGKIRRHFKLKGKVGHAGTLDPMATGVLVVAVDRATRLLPYLNAADKEYVAQVTLGQSTDTLDREGKITETMPVPNDWRGRLEAAMKEALTRTAQIPPRVSAIHVDGERAHDRARRGEEFDLPARAVRLLELELLSEAPLTAEALRFRLSVEKGYYVRSFARDLGRDLGTVAHLSELRRTRSGIFAIAEAQSLESFSGGIVTLESMAKRLFPSVTLAAEDIRALMQGKRHLATPTACDANAKTAETVGMFSEEGVLVGCQKAAFEGDALLLGEDAVRFPEM